MSNPPADLSLEQLQQLAAVGEPPDAALILDLLATMSHSQEELRAWASDVLQTVEVLPRSLADSVAAKCLDPHPAVAACACTLLAKLASDASQYQGPIASCLDTHSSVSTRQQAALALGSIAQRGSATLVSPRHDSAAPNASTLQAPTVEALRRAAASGDPRLKRLAEAALAGHAKTSS